MKKLTILALSMFFFISFAAQAQIATLDEEQTAITKVIQSAYVEGLQNEGNADKIDAGFHPGFNLLGIGQGQQMWQLPIYNWKEKALDDVKEGKKPRTGEKEVTVNFLSVDVTGTAAVVKLEFLVGGKKTYVDYLSLYKFEGQWKIVNKIFYKFPEEDSEKK